MKRRVVDGERIYLRPLERTDINERYLSWVNDAEVTRYMKTGFFPSLLEDLEKFYEGVTKGDKNMIFAVVAKDKGLHIGNIKLGGIEWQHQHAHLGVMIGDKSYWRKGYGREACDTLLKYAFKELNLNKVLLAVYGNHAAAIKMYEGLGCRIEGQIRDILFFESDRVDEVVMGISRKEYMERAGAPKKAHSAPQAEEAW